MDKGFIITLIGIVYEGGFACGLTSGAEVNKYFSGDVYDEKYDKDLKSDQGKFIFVQRNFYVQKFQKVCFHGNGNYFFNQNQSITGTWNYWKLQNNKETKTPAHINTFSTNSIQNSSITKTPNKTLRNPSPIRYTFSTYQIPVQRNFSPFSHEKNHSINTQKQQKASVVNINLNKSPIKKSKFSEVRTPSDSYFKQGPFIPSSGQELSQLTTSKQKPTFTQQKHKFRDSNQQSETENQMKFKKLFTKQYSMKIIFEKKAENKNLFNLMDGGSEEEHDNKVVPPLLLNHQSSLPIAPQQQVPRKSKRKLQY